MSSFDSSRCTFSTTLPKLLATVFRLYEFGLSNGLSFPLYTRVISPCLKRFVISQVFIILLVSFVTCSIKASPPNFICSVCRPRISAAFPHFDCLITVLTKSSGIIISSLSFLHYYFIKCLFNSILVVYSLSLWLSGDSELAILLKYFAHPSHISELLVGCLSSI